MKDLFLDLLHFFERIGDITEALMYDGGEFSSIKIKTSNGKYTISISKEKAEEEADGNS